MLALLDGEMWQSCKRASSYVVPIHSRVQVYWPDDDTWWSATVLRCDVNERKLQLLYSNMQVRKMIGTTALLQVHASPSCCFACNSIPGVCLQPQQGLVGFDSPI